MPNKDATTTTYTVVIAGCARVAVRTAADAAPLGTVLSAEYEPRFDQTICQVAGVDELEMLEWYHRECLPASREGALLFYSPKDPN